MGIRVARRSVITLATAGALASSGTLYLGVRNLLAGQADLARQTIPRACEVPPRADGIYVAGDATVERFQRGMSVDLHLMFYGD
jgi:hypothetical protein